MKTTYIITLTAILMMCSVAAAGEKMVDNPEYLEWSKFKVDSYVSYKDITSGEGGDIELFSTVKLVEITKDKAVLEVTSYIMLGEKKLKTSSEKKEIAAKITEAKLALVKVKPDKKGKETLEINGKKIKTKWEKNVLEITDNKSTTTIWKSDKVPGHLVKRILDMDSMKITRIVTDYEAK